MPEKHDFHPCLATIEDRVSRISIRDSDCNQVAQHKKIKIKKKVSFSLCWVNALGISRPVG